MGFLTTHTITRTVTLEGFYLINRIKKIVESASGKKDKRMVVDPIEFLSCLIFSFTGDAKVFSLESIRRTLIAESGSNISRSAFWERLISQSLTKKLSESLNHIMNLINGQSGLGHDLEKSLGVTGISMFDSSIVTLSNFAKEDFDSTFTEAGIKFHLESDGVSGGLRWSILSSASVHDNCGFPNIQDQSGRLSIFDLGYFDWVRFANMDQCGAFFLSRVKSNAAIRILEAVDGISAKHNGKLLKNLKFTRSRGTVVEFLTERRINGEYHKFRVIGFWNKAQKRYHWYITNLNCSAKLISPLYRYRWQIELLIKAAKQTLNMDQIPSSNRSIIINLSIARLIALGVAMVVKRVADINIQDATLRGASSIQRAAKVLSILASDFLFYIINTSRAATLKDKMYSLIHEMVDPNGKKRKTSFTALRELASAIG